MSATEREPSEIVVRGATADDPSWLAIWVEPIEPGPGYVGTAKITRLAISKQQLQSIVDAAIALDLVEIR